MTNDLSVHPKAAPIRISSGSILVYRIFDIAAEIHLRKVEETLAQSGGARLKFQRQGHQAIIIKNAPVRLSLGDVLVEAAGKKFKAEGTATIWDYGVLSICFSIPIESGCEWNELIRVGASLHNASEIDQMARARSKEITQLLTPALKEPGEWDVCEDYIIYSIQKLEGAATPSELLDRADVPALLLSEPKERLSDQSREGLFEYVYQYADDDLVVIDWNSALVLEPEGSREVIDVLEFAVTQLLELRYYDDLLDHRLNELYDAIEERRQSVLKSYFSGLLKETNSRYLEFTEVTERVNNSLKVVGDFYLAVIFRAAIRRFRVPDWQASITRKISLLARVSELIQGEVNVHRSHLLEIVVVILILIEVIKGFAG